MFLSRDPNGSRDLNVTRGVVMMVSHVTPADRIIPGGNQSRDMMSCRGLILSYLILSRSTDRPARYLILLILTPVGRLGLSRFL